MRRISQFTQCRFGLKGEFLDKTEGNYPRVAERCKTLQTQFKTFITSFRGVVARAEGREGEREK